MNHLIPKQITKGKAVGCGPFSMVTASADSLRRGIFERIRAEGAVSRATIAKDLGISPASVTTQTSALIELGLVKELPATHEPSDQGRGRPPIALGVVPGSHLVAGIKLTGETHTAVVLDFAGQQIASATIQASPETDTQSVINSANSLIQAVCKSANIAVNDLSAVGVGVPGFVSHEDGLVHWSPILDSCPVDLATLMSAKLGIPVTIDNDANLIALAELWFGAGREISNFAVVTIEHGVGMGLVLDHALYRGARGMGMELGHTKVSLDGALCRCGQRGCLEAYVADYALVREAAVAMKSKPAPGSSVKSILEALHTEAKNGNLVSRAIFERAGKYLALALGNVLNLFDPQKVILSGERMQYDYLYSDTILDEVKRYSLNSNVAPPPIEVHAWGDMVWASGAAALALTFVTQHQLALSPSVAA